MKAWYLVLALAVAVTGCDTWTCSSETCPSGCCDGRGTCILNGGRLQCGRLGAACRACTGACDAGACVAPVDAGRVCPSGEVLVGSECRRCTPSTCPTGCCSNDSCMTPSLSFCGVGGATCVSCGNASGGTVECASGRCRTCDLTLSTCTPGSCCGNATCRTSSTDRTPRCWP
ncbi:MAG: hypothetical protein INH41_06185 [Myxococcaceae bacterium]|nr:hypothetical protein [Myxococcaceae bacterium]MCA3011976.1 hypothetical protein [Myxococcaceae bacterium]